MLGSYYAVLVFVCGATVAGEGFGHPVGWANECRFAVEVLIGESVLVDKGLRVRYEP